MNVLPVRTVPQPGEYLHSFIERTIRENSLEPGALELRPLIRRERFDAGMLDLVAGAVRVEPSALREMTFEVYPAGLVGRGRRRNVISRTWRLPGVRWSCPACTRDTGVYLRDWQFALHPLCVRCPRLLQQHPTDGVFDAGRVPDAAALATQARIARALGRQRREPGAIGNFRRTYKMVTLLSLTADHDWPRLTGWEAEMVSGLGPDRYRDWRRRAPRDPVQAVLVLEAWRGVESPERGQRLIAEGWQRVRVHPDPSVRALEDSWRKVFPRPPAPSMRLPGTPVDRVSWRELHRLVIDLDAMATQSGMDARHVPAWLALGDEGFAPPHDQWVLRGDLAAVTYMLLSGRVHHDGAETRARKRLGLRRGPRSVSRWVQTGRGISRSNADAIRQFATAIVRAGQADGFVDYARRRRALTLDPDLEQRLLAVRARHAIPGDTAAVWAWVWVFLTRGPCRTRAATDSAVVLDQRLRPGQRAALIDIAHEILHRAERHHRSPHRVGADDGRGV